MDVHQYWHGGDLPPLAQLSATTLLAHHATVTLCSYEPLANLPPGVRTRDARDAWPEAKWRAFLDGCSHDSSHKRHAVASDVVRIAILRHVLRESDSTAIWADSDVLCLHQFPAPDESGIAFSSLHSKRSGAFKSTTDHLSLGVLIVEAEALPFLDMCFARMQRTGAGGKYSKLMNVANNVRQQLRLTNLYPPMAFCPIPYFCAVKAQKQDGFVTNDVQCPPADRILSESFAVHVFASKVTIDPKKYHTLPVASCLYKVLHALLQDQFDAGLLIEYANGLTRERVSLPFDVVAEIRADNDALLATPYLAGGSPEAADWLDRCCWDRIGDHPPFDAELCPAVLLVEDTGNHSSYTSRTASGAWPRSASALLPPSRRRPSSSTSPPVLSWHSTSRRTVTPPLPPSRNPWWRCSSWRRRCTVGSGGACFTDRAPTLQPWGTTGSMASSALPT